MSFDAKNRMDLIWHREAFNQRGETLVKQRFHTCGARQWTLKRTLGFLTRDLIAVCVGNLVRYCRSFRYGFSCLYDFGRLNWFYPITYTEVVIKPSAA